MRRNKWCSCFWIINF